VRCRPARRPTRSIRRPARVHPEHAIHWYLKRIHPLDVGLPHPRNETAEAVRKCVLGASAGLESAGIAPAIHSRHLTAASAHIPDPHEKTTIFYGWYSNRTRGHRKQRGLRGKAGATTPAHDEPTPLAVRQAWAHLIRKVHEVNPLLCPRCGGTMRVVAVRNQPDVFRQILVHLGIARPPQTDRPPPVSRSSDSCEDASRVRESPRPTPPHPAASTFAGT